MIVIIVQQNAECEITFTKTIFVQLELNSDNSSWSSSSSSSMSLTSLTNLNFDPA